MRRSASSEETPTTGARLALDRGARFGEHELVARIAKGGMGSVWAARRRAPGGLVRVVALKVPHRAGAPEDALEDEARIAARIDHPHVVRTLGLERDPSAGVALVMEYVEGASLRELFEASAGPTPPRVALRIVHDALLGLAAAHDARDEQGRVLALVHHDVSPANVLVRTDGRALLADFGVARAMGSTPEPAPSTRVKGKLGYFAPEQLAGARVDRRIDVYAMGIVLWELLVGRRLFEGGMAALLRTIERDAPALRSVAPGLAPLSDTLARALARDPGARFATAASFACALEHDAAAIGGLASRFEVARHLRGVLGARLAREREALFGALAPARRARSEVITLDLRALRDASGVHPVGFEDEPTAPRRSRARPATSGVHARPSVPPLRPSEDLEPTDLDPTAPAPLARPGAPARWARWITTALGALRRWIRPRRGAR